MNKRRIMRYISVSVVIAALPLTAFWCSSYNYNKQDPIISKIYAASKNDFGGVSFVSSLPNNNSKQTIVNEMTKLGVGWAREEYTYSNGIDFTPYDVAYAKLRAANLNILGLLTCPESKNHDQWKTYVTAMVNHFPSVNAWEIMNEADNYLSGQDYVSYLKEARTIIKARNPSATIVLSGITARVESPNFWNGVSAGGGWGDFDVLGLHVFHNTDPYHDSYNNGTLSQEIQHAVDSINRNGGGKKIWVTEFGWDSNKFGLDNQANWLYQGLPIVHGFSQVEKIFIFRMFEHDNGFGLLNSSFAEKPSFGKSKDAIACLINGSCMVSQQTATPVAQRSPTPRPSPIIINANKSSIRLDRLDNLSSGQNNYRIVVVVKDENNNLIKYMKPKIVLDGGQTELTDFVLVGNEWFGYVTSNSPGQRTAKISAGGQVLGTLDMAFEITITPSPSPSPLFSVSSSPLVEADQESKSSIPFVLLYLTGSLVTIGGLIYLYFSRRKRMQAKIDK